MDKLSARQTILIASGLLLNTTLISTPMLMVEEAKQSAVFAYLIGILLTLLSWWLVCRTLGRFPGRDLFEVLIDRFRWAGSLLAILYMAFFFLILTRDIRTLVDFVNYTLLPTTPMLLLTLLIVFTVALIARGGMVLIGRLSELYQVCFIVVILLLPLLLWKELDPRNLKPFLEYGLTPVFRASWYSIAYLGEIIALPFLLAFQASHFRRGLWGILLGIGLLELLLLLALLVLNPELTSRFVYPYYHLIREIRVTDFLDRFDLIIVGFWMPSFFVKIGITFYFICHGFLRLMPKVNFRLLTLPIAFLAAGCSLWFYASYVQLLHFNKVWPIIALFFELLLPLMFFLFLRPKEISEANNG